MRCRHLAGRLGNILAIIANNRDLAIKNSTTREPSTESRVKASSYSIFELLSKENVTRICFRRWKVNYLLRFICHSLATSRIDRRISCTLHFRVYKYYHSSDLNFEAQWQNSSRKKQRVQIEEYVLGKLCFLFFFLFFTKFSPHKHESLENI